MSHFIVSAIFPTTVDIKELRESLKNESQKYRTIDVLTAKVEKPFSAFDLNKGKPHKVYYSKETINEFAKHYNINSTDLNLIKDKLNEKFSAEIGIDEKGVFAISTENKNGKFDYWEAYDVFLIEDLLKDDFVSHAIFTPDSRFIDSEHWFYSVGDSNEKDFTNWNKEYKNILSKYSPNSLVLLISCHI